MLTQELLFFHFHPGKDKLDINSRANNLGNETDESYFVKTLKAYII